jgi:hypothetical protein
LTGITPCRTARDLGEAGRDLAAAAVIEVADRGVGDPQPADLRNRRRAFGRGFLELPVGRAVRARLEPERGLADTDLRQLEPAMQQRRQIDHELGLLHR